MNRIPVHAEREAKSDSTLVPFSEQQASIARSALDQQHLLSGQFWGEMRVFLAVAKAKSFNRAAEILNTSQPTVARQVKRLQDMMGSQLFLPTQTGVKLTTKGQDLAMTLSRLDHTLFSLTNELRAEKHEAEGLVRITVTDGLNTLFVAPALREFSYRYPRIQCQLKSPTNFLSLRENQTDLMLGFRPADAADITTKPLGWLHFIPIVTKQYVLERGLPTRKNLASHLFLQSEMYSARTGLWDGWNEVIAQGHIAHYCDNSFAYGMLVKAGIGIGLLGNYTLIEPNAVPIEIMTPVAVQLYALVFTARLDSRPVHAVFDWICEIFGPHNPWFNEKIKLDDAPTDYDFGFRALFNL